MYYLYKSTDGILRKMDVVGIYYKSHSKLGDYM